jgi:prevent-host-death family protein
MTKHFNVGEAKAQLSKLIDAAVRGEDVVIDRAGKPRVRLVPTESPDNDTERQKRAAKRQSAFGMWRDAFSNWEDVDIGPSMTDEEVEERWQRKFGPTA